MEMTETWRARQTRKEYSNFQVAENTDLKERFLTADVKGVDQLGAAQHGEGHGPARRWGSGAVEEHPADGESQQRDHADEAALDGDAVGHTPGEQAFFWRRSAAFS